MSTIQVVRGYIAANQSPAAAVAAEVASSGSETPAAGNFQPQQQPPQLHLEPTAAAAVAAEVASSGGETPAAGDSQPQQQPPQLDLLSQG
eukprot:g75752.t1